MKDGQLENKPSIVPEMAKQEGEVMGRWAWTEPSVWTQRMLTALENGVKGGKWYSLMDKIYSQSNLLRSLAIMRLRSIFANVAKVRG